MSRVWGKIAGLFSKRTFVGTDKSGNKYFTRFEDLDGVTKEKRWVIFKGEDEPTSIPVEWICWLNGQRKKAPTPEEMMELEARRERVKLNVALLKKEEEEKRARQASSKLSVIRSGKEGGPDLESFIKQFPYASEGTGATDNVRSTDGSAADKDAPSRHKQQQESTEPTGSGESFRPGTWQPPT